jgi:adenylate kinase family enzyme
MSNKIIILGPSAAGKSTLMRYLRKHTDLNIVEMDEEVTKANDNKWPSDNEYKDRVLVPKIVENVLKEDGVVYIASYVPTRLIRKARQNGFKIALLQLGQKGFVERNIQRMKAEGYADASPWFQKQLESYQRLIKAGLIDEVIDAHKPISDVANIVLQLAKTS